MDQLICALFSHNHCWYEVGILKVPALLLLFLTFSALVANPKKTTLHGGQSRSWSAEQGKKKKKSGSALPPLPPPRARAARSNKKSRDASTCLGATQVGVTQVVSVRLASVQVLSWPRIVTSHKDSYDSSARPMGVASQNSTLSSAIATFPVSLPLSSPGDVWPCLPLLPSTRP